MLEMTGVGKDHADAVFIAGINHFFVADGTAGLNDGGNTGLGNKINIIPEREIGI